MWYMIIDERLNAENLFGTLPQAISSQETSVSALGEIVLISSSSNGNCYKPPSARRWFATFDCKGEILKWKATY